MPQFSAAMREAVEDRRTNRAWRAPTAGLASSLAERNSVTIDAENRTVTVTAALPLNELHDALARHGLSSSLPYDGARVDAVVTGGAAARAAVRDTLLAVHATLPDGASVRFGGSTVKDVAGYDLKRLFIGSGSQFGTLRTVTLQVHALKQR